MRNPNEQCLIEQGGKGRTRANIHLDHSHDTSTPIMQQWLKCHCEASMFFRRRTEATTTTNNQSMAGVKRILYIGIYTKSWHQPYRYLAPHVRRAFYAKPLSIFYFTQLHPRLTIFQHRTSNQADSPIVAPSVYYQILSKSPSLPS